MLPIHLREPSSEPARRRTAAALARRSAAPALDRPALLRDRARAAPELLARAARLEATLAALGVRTTRAADAAQAADLVAARAAGTPVAVSRAAVIGELYGELVRRGVALVTTYGPGERPFAGRRQRFWQLPAHGAPAGWSTARLGVAPEAQRREVLGLLGVNAISATSGAVHLVAHSGNIAELLRTARRLVLVVGLEKIAADDAAAGRQVEAVTAAGTDAVLLDLCRTPPAGRPLERFPVAAAEPPEVEVVLLDGGRAALAGGPHEALLACIGCRACATRCPTYPLFRGERGWSPRDYLWSHLRGENPSLELCTFCGNCEVDCPVEIPLPTMIATRRAEAIAARGRGVAGWRRRVEGEVERIDRAFAAAGPLGARLQHAPLAGLVMERVFGLSCERPLPAFRSDSFERWHAARGRDPGRRRAGARGSAERGAEGSGERPRLVYYFGCFANWNDPDVGRAAVGVLEALGWEVVLPAWRCCGIPLYAKGEIVAARRLAAANVASLAAHVDAGDLVVTSCPSCHLALARDYPRLFPSAEAERVAAHTHFLSRFLLERGELDGRLGRVVGRAGYHLPCHLRALGMERDSLDLLARIGGLHVADLGRGCCGMSGTFGVERAHYAQSMEIGAGVFAAASEARPELLLTDCGACKLQLEHGTGRVVSHPLEVVQWALREASDHGAVGAGPAQREALADATEPRAAGWRA